MTYLNHAGTSWPKPAPVRAAVARALEAQAADWPGSFEAARGRVADALGVADPERLLLTPGCTSALSVAVADHPWQAGERILTSSLEHHALLRPVEALVARGVEPGVVPRGTDGPFDLDALEGELRRGGVRLVAVCAACNVSGELLPLPEIIALARAHGALCLVDGAQVAGWMPLDLDTLGADLFAFAGHKALQGPWGIGGLVVGRDVALSSPAATCDLPAPGEAAACATMPGYCDVGSVDMAALAGLVAALDWLGDSARGDRLARARAQIERLAAALEAHAEVRLLGRRRADARLPTLAFSRAGTPSTQLARPYERAGIRVASGFQCAPRAHAALGSGADGAVRLSAGPTTSDADVERALEVIATP